MLVLAREKDEWIDIELPSGRIISVCVVKILPTSGTVKIGIEAPTNITIYRRELLNRIKLSKQCSDDKHINSNDKEPCP